MVQRAQNKVLRVLNRAQIVDQKSTRSCAGRTKYVVGKSDGSTRCGKPQMTHKKWKHGIILRKVWKQGVVPKEIWQRVEDQHEPRKASPLMQQKYGTKHHRRQGQLNHWLWPKRQSEPTAKVYLFRNFCKVVGWGCYK